MKRAIKHHLISIRFLFTVNIIAAICLAGYQSSIPSQPSLLEKQLILDIEDHQLDDFSLIEAALILSGITREDSLNHYLAWYTDLVEKIRGFHFDPIDRVGSASNVFNYLHATWLKKYERESTTLLDVIHKKEYNCVAATILYNLICEDMGWPTEAFETPTHVYTIFSNFTQSVMVENTNPMGFNIIKNLRAYSRYLAQFYPENQAVSIGLDRLYAYENSKGRPIDNTELLGLLAYNRAYFARKKGDYARAYDLVLLAQYFNQDSRSNVAFEKDLYYLWGRQLFDRKQYEEAFEVLADGFYRYPEIKEFAQNTRASFQHCINHYWSAKNWDRARQLIDEIMELKILEENDLNGLQQLLSQWARHAYQKGEKIVALEVIGYMERLGIMNHQMQSLKSAILSMQ